MSITSAELIAYAAASKPLDDTSLTGGAIDPLVRPTFTQFTGNAVVAMVSSGADSRPITVTGRLVTGVLTQENVQTNGTNEVLSVNTYERVLSVIATAVSGTTVSVKQGSGGTVRGTIPATEKGFTALFINSASDPSIGVDRVEKIFLKNTNASLTLTSSIVTLTADPQSRITIGLSTTIDDTGTIANRLATPGGVSFVDDNVDQNVPSSQNLAAASAIGVWVKQGLLAADAAFKSTFTVRLQGNTI